LNSEHKQNAEIFNELLEYLMQNRLINKVKAYSNVMGVNSYNEERID
jgi:hypothetical protein